MPKSAISCTRAPVWLACLHSVVKAALRLNVLVCLEVTLSSATGRNCALKNPDHCPR
jgi:hypothetical protein